MTGECIGADVGVFRNLKVAMRDGVELAADLYLPLVGGQPQPNVRYPVVLVRSPYNKGFVAGSFGTPSYLVRSGYAVLEAARDGQRLIVGPWGHIADDMLCRFPGALVDDVAAMGAWMDQHLRGIRGDVPDHRVTLYVMGENRWRAEAAWPLPDAQPTLFYLRGDGHANGAAGDGVLSTTPPGNDEQADTYLSDPRNPVASLGGHSLHGGPADQRPNDARPDILVYTTPVLDADVEVTGPMRATIYASSSGTDTDWFIKLVDVFPDGRSYNLVTGMTRARYRKSRTAPEPLTPGAVECYELDMWATSNVFKRGHRIRVIISSSDYPNTDLNPNGFVDLSTSTIDDRLVAHQTIYHDAARPSAVELPLIPVDRARNWTETPFPSGESGRFYGRPMPVEELPPIEMSRDRLPY